MKTILSFIGLLLVSACDLAGSGSNTDSPTFEAEMPVTGVIHF